MGCDMSLTLQQVARALDGEVSGDQVRAPGPGHSRKDRSLSVKLDDNGEPIVHSFADDEDLKCKDDDEDLKCKDYVRERCGLPPWQPRRGKARETIASLPHIAGSDFVFTTTGTTPISGWSRAKDKLGDVASWRIHDLRRTTATGLQRLGTALPVTESILGHVAGSRAGIVGIYQRHDYADEKRAALEAWGEFVTELVDSQS
jgi:hypothetical protein